MREIRTYGSEGRGQKPPYPIRSRSDGRRGDSSAIFKSVSGDREHGRWKNGSR